jgi:hypothetical protein
MATSTATDPESARKHPIEPRHPRSETPRQRQRTFMHDPAEHHMGHDVELALQRLRDMGVIIAVAGGPPRRDAVDQFPAVGERMRLPRVALTGSGAPAVFICAWAARCGKGHANPPGRSRRRRILP